MLNRSIVYIFAFLVFLVWTSGASASPFHEHEHGKKGASVEVSKAQHACPMNHAQKGLPCPHIQSKKGNSKECQIAPDCGGAPLGSIPASVNLSKNLLSIFDLSSLTPADKTESLFYSSSSYQFNFSSPLDHPPKSL